MTKREVQPGLYKNTITQEVITITNQSEHPLTNNKFVNYVSESGKFYTITLKEFESWVENEDEQHQVYEYLGSIS